MSELNWWIPIRPHLLRYVLWREHLEAGQPIIIPGYSPIAQALDLCITNKTNFLAASMRREEPSLHEYNERLYYSVRGSRSAHNYFFVATNIGIAFNKFIHHLLHDDLLTRVQAGQASGAYEINIIQDFLEQVGIEDMVDYASVKKAQTRLRQAKGFVMQKGRPARGEVFHSPVRMRV